jgi:CDP-diacylglycerol--glycerol-3-phosphate 3-phosphatidyltransferase
MNLANKLTILRIFMIPVFLIVLLQNTETMFMIAGLIFIVASLTDFLDGYIARSRNMITKFGKFMDPLADKLLTMAAFVAFVELQLMPAWVVILIIARELTISVFRAIAAAEGLVLAAGVPDCLE